MAIRTLTLSTPLAVSSTATFSIYSVHGDGAKSPLDLADRDSYEVSDGQLIHMVAPGNLSLYIHNVSGLAETDLRKINFEVDYGERWDAQFLTDPHLPAGFTTPAPDGATMGLYPGFVSGHAMRGTDMLGNQVLTADYNGDAGPIGTKDNTVTVTVSDNSGNSASMSFTVRLIHPLRYYAEGGATYPRGYRGGREQNRLGVIYVSRDGDFTGCPTGPNIYHHTLPSGIIRKQATFYALYPGNREAGEEIRDTETDTLISDYPFIGNGPSTAIYFKAGETYVGDEELGFGTFNETNCLVGSWGTDATTGDRAIFSGEPRQRWYPTPLAFMGSNAVNTYRGLRFQNILFHFSDYDPSDATWTEWWNIIKMQAERSRRRSFGTWITAMGPVSSGVAMFSTLRRVMTEQRTSIRQKCLSTARR